MKIKFIGTGSGVTSLKRFHSSMIFSDRKYKLVIDTGDGISKALLASKVSFKVIDGILLSHLHPDHFSGLASLIVQMKLSGRKKSLDIFIHKSLVDVVEKFLKQSYILYERLSFRIKYKLFEHNDRINITEDFYFTAKQNTHLDHYKKYDKNNTLSFSCSSFLFECKNKNIMYTGDIGRKEDINLFEGKEISYLISEVSHLEISDIVLMLRNLKTDRICLTHICDADEGKLRKFYRKLSKREREKVMFAYDGMTVNL